MQNEMRIEKTEGIRETRSCLSKIEQLNGFCSALMLIQSVFVR